MKTNTAITTSTPLSTILHLPSAPPRLAALLLAAAALLLQGCTTARPAWSYRTDPNPLSTSAYERMEPRGAIPLVSFNF
jgi:hypothetical protein